MLTLIGDDKGVHVGQCVQRQTSRKGALRKPARAGPSGPEHVTDTVGGAVHEADQDKPVARADDCENNLIPMDVALAHMTAATACSSLPWHAIIFARCKIASGTARSPSRTQIAVMSN